MILAGDIGGTNTRLGLFDHEHGPRAPLAQVRYTSGDDLSLEDIVKRFLAATGASVEGAAFGVAGPVLEGKARITNLPWTVDQGSLARLLSLDDVAMINDLVATANGIPHLDGDDLHRLDDAKAVIGGPIGVVAPGTGLGEAYLVWNGQRYQAHASEGGHASFAPRTEVEIELLRFLMQRYEHVSYERVCSGSGIPNLYEFFAQRHPEEVDRRVEEAVANADDPTPVIVGAAMEEQRPDAISRRSVETFVSILGAETGNLALKLLATGGMFLGGGIPPRIVPLLDSHHFGSTYTHKGRFGEMVSQIPVRVILEPGAALIGAAALALERTQSAGCEEP